jgi:hypothetical protein
MMSQKWHGPELLPNRADIRPLQMGRLCKEWTNAYSNDVILAYHNVKYPNSPK